MIREHQSYSSQQQRREVPRGLTSPQSITQVRPGQKAEFRTTLPCHGGPRRKVKDCQKGDLGEELGSPWRLQGQMAPGAKTCVMVLPHLSSHYKASRLSLKCLFQLHPLPLLPRRASWGRLVPLSAPHPFVTMSKSLSTSAHLPCSEHLCTSECWTQR